MRNTDLSQWIRGEIMPTEKKKIVVADDELRLRELVSDFLTKEGYEPISANDGNLAVDIVRGDNSVALVILDVMIPEMDGWTACRKIREFSDVPIIMLTARSEEFDQLLGFEAGADDYVTKPFSPTILVKRVEALLRRSSRSSSVQQRLEIDSSAYTAKLDGTVLELTVKEFEILDLLYKNPARVFTRSQLLDIVWGYDYDGDSRTVDSHIARLRLKMGDYGNAHLKTVYGIGYKLEL